MIYDIALSLTPNVGSKTAAQLLDRFGSAGAVMQANHAMLVESGCSEKLARSLGDRTLVERAARIIDQCKRTDVRILVRGSENYPTLLDECPDAPHILYAFGEVDFNAGKWVSVVGTRKASAEGLQVTRTVVDELATAYDDVVIVSGLALGIDRSAHEAAIAVERPTVAVMPGWIFQITPTRHLELARTIARKGGAIVSDMPPGTVITKRNFISRNRIIAGLSSATFVIESASKGGSLITADIAGGYNRSVFAIPGRSSDANFAGTNALIKTNKAILYQDITDIATELRWTRRTSIDVSETVRETLPQYLLKVYDAVSDDPSTLDAICDQCDMELADTSSSLLQLELSGLIKSIPGGLYIRAKY